MLRFFTIISVCAVLFALIFLSCGSDKKEEFTVEEKQLYDSLKIIAFKDIRNRTDRECEKVKDSLYNIYVDSLLNLRREEIEQLFEK